MKVFLILLVCLISYSHCWNLFYTPQLNLKRILNRKLPQLDTDLVVEQKRDHFNLEDNTTWKQHYYVNETFFIKGKQNVAFLMISGNLMALPNWMTSGSWIPIAKKNNALLFQLEHRFYGKSLPTEDLSLDNLRFLTSEQALADIANFIVEMNKKYCLGKNVKWIIFGGSYAGNLAAWSRQKYPHLIHGAVSSSAPVLSKLDFSDYYRVVKDDLLAKGGEECIDTIKTATEKMTKLLNSSNVSDLDEMFKLCAPIKDNINIIENIQILFDSLANNIGLTAVEGELNRFGQKNEITLDTVCEIMTNKSIGSEIQRYAEVNNNYLQVHQSSCTNYMYSDLINYLKIDSVDLGGDRQWMYQRCSQFAYFQTSNSEPHIFSNFMPLSYWVKLCTDIFGEEYDQTMIEKGIYETNLIHGGQNINATNVVYVHGSFDPWHPLGVLKDSTNAPVILINGTSHMADLYDETEDDPAELKAARKQINDFITQWLSQ